MILRNVTILDSQAVLDIYQPYVLNTAVTFEYTVPTLEEFSRRIEGIVNCYPFFVCEFQKKVIGYAYAQKFRERAAYNWDIETSVYILDEFQNQGVASLLYTKLLEECTNRGFHNAFAGITLPNEKSVRFHSKFGFTHVGVFKNAGYKQADWHSVLFMEKNLIPCDREPKEIKWR